jgi:hypothetical protein
MCERLQENIFLRDRCSHFQYVLQKKITGKKQHFKEFRIQLAEMMVESVALPDYPRRGRPQQDPSPCPSSGLLLGLLFQDISPNPQKKNPCCDCVVCKAKRRRVKPDMSVPSVWWRYMFQTVLGCITPQHTYK